MHFSLRGHEWILLKNVCINMASVKIFFSISVFFSSFQSVPWKLRILNVISKRHSNYLTRGSLCYRKYTSPQTNTVSGVNARPHPLIGLSSPNMGRTRLYYSITCKASGVISRKKTNSCPKLKICLGKSKSTSPWARTRNFTYQYHLGGGGHSN